MAPSTTCPPICRAASHFGPQLQHLHVIVTDTMHTDSNWIAARHAGCADLCVYYGPGLVEDGLRVTIRVGFRAPPPSPLLPPGVVIEGVTGIPTPCLCFLGMVTTERLKADQEYEDVSARGTGEEGRKGSA